MRAPLALQAGTPYRPRSQMAVAMVRKSFARRARYAAGDAALPFRTQVAAHYYQIWRFMGLGLAGPRPW